jgi:hypothetical protein
VKKQVGKPTKAARTARRERIAAKVVAGSSIQAVADTEGLTRVWTSKELAAPETQAIVARLVDTSHIHMAGMFSKALTAIAEAFDARKEYVVAGQIEIGGPDHYARLKAANTLTDLLKAGRAATQPPKNNEERRLLTLDEINQALRAARGQ